MAPHFGKKGEYDKKKVVGSLRRTQLVTTFGSGSIVDMPDYSVIIAATNYWKESSPVLHEPNLERLLKVSCFKQPCVTDNPDGDYAPDIPAFRFPTMHFCPECGKLMPYWGFGDESGRKCTQCNKNIVPSRFVAACINGHLEDFPYRWWVHNGDFSECSATDKDASLKISFSDETGGLESIIITCTACNKSRSMAGSMGRNALKGYHCRGKRPWIGMKHIYDDPVACNAPLRGLQRGASNVYFSQTASALTIPPWSSRLSQEIALKWDQISPRLDAGIDRDHLRSFVEGMFASLLQLETYTTDDILKEIERYRNQDDGGEYTKQDLYEDEYQVFCLGDYEQPDDFQFRIERTDVPEILDDYIEDVVMVKRLREVLALKGFRRISPEKPDTDDERFAGYSLENDCVPLSETPLNWYPGIEMLGEGIFIRLREDILSEWENNNTEYYEPMLCRLEVSNVECDNFSPRYVLLHTLSHLLIRQLSVECGYSGAAIKERIYSTYPDSSHKMAGILLYTSSSDSDGSLGGLVRNALPEVFERVFRNMLQEASWCSSDPICISSRAQGYDSLNYAACHACTLLPETSCEMRNCLLDRGSVVGSIQDRKRGFFGGLFS
ncbi:MAG: DUF1998 domain-containing protein [Bacteroides thetaiotaomicron]|nr:DUF1998 domain-containing protein [Bacteroides thetaiotaomicron]